MLTQQTALLVDDNPFIRAVLGTYLQESQHMTICAEACDGLEAVEKAKTFNPDLVLMDISMPRMNGLEAASVIRRDVPASRIVVFTMFSDLLGQAVVRAAGVDLVVSKSGGLHGLMESLEDCLCRK